MRKFYFPFRALLIPIFLGFYQCQAPVKSEQTKVYFSNSNFEIDPNFLVTADNSVIFSANNSEFYSLYKYNEGKISSLARNLPKHVIKPFTFRNEIIGLIDSTTDKHLSSTSHFLNRILGEQKISAVFSFKDGNLLIARTAKDKNVHYVDINTGTNISILRNIDKLHAVCYYAKSNALIVNYDTKLSIINLRDFKETQLDGDLDGEKMNPFVHDDILFYTNNSDSEFYQIFKINLSDKIKHRTLVVRGEHDLLLPKFEGRSLYFIEVNNGEYLLKKLDINTGLTVYITKKGVVYDYDFIGDKNVVFSYSDIVTPKSLMSVKEGDTSITNLTGKSFNLKIEYSLLKRTQHLSPSYVIGPKKEVNTRGIVLFLHPGLHNDFSPRWDPLLINLSNNGYTIVAPNFPMSFGLGKSYYRSNYSLLLNDINSWKEFILEKYKAMPLYFLGYSSGNTVMEHVLSENSNGVSAAVSVFGVPASDKPDNGVPTLYILGELDPSINFDKRKINLGSAGSNVSVLSYENEGHWFLRSKNLEDSLQKILDYFSQHR